MRLRTPLAVAVVGALLVGGATTGTTLAHWRDMAPMPATSVTSGTMSHAVSLHGEAPGIPALVAGGPAAVIEGTVRDTSSPGARNLRQDISVTDVVLRDATNQLQLSHLGVAVTPRPTSGCASNFTDAVGGEDAHLGRTAPGGPDASIDVCVTVVAKAGAPSSTGTVLLAFSGEQVRPGGQPAGWTSAASTTVALTVEGVVSPPAPSGLRCVSSSKGVSATITWQKAPDATYSLVNNGQVKLTDITSSMLPLTVRPSDVGGNNVDLKVRATTPAGVSTDSSSTFDIQFQAPKCSVS